MNAMIQTACQSMQTNGFTGFYQSLVNQVVPNNPVSYGEFVNRTNRATLPLTNDNDALFYSVAYAMAHYQTFLAVLSHYLSLDSDDSLTVFNVIDYGCGQGVATLATLDFIANQANPKNIHLNIHLIEPSAVALGNACYKILSLAQAHGFSVNITTQNCELNQATVPNFNNGAETLHLMSYILDVASVQNQLHHISSQISQLAGIHYVVASDISTPDGFFGLNLLSLQLTGVKQTITRHSPQHYSYRVMQNRYEYDNAKAIGLMIALNNDLVFNQAA